MSGADPNAETREVRVTAGSRSQPGRPPSQIGLHSHSLGLSNSVERRFSMMRGGKIPLPLSVGRHVLITVEAYFVSWHLFLDYWTSECRSY